MFLYLWDTTEKLPFKTSKLHVKFFPPQAEKLAFFLVLERDLGVDHEEVRQVAASLSDVQVSMGRVKYI